ncbi:ATP-binding protein [Couchioplanes caeruleus]|uniref:ATP-binding protein n=1 Tax=Couchioplanes caeruleus TaxID=56438 RepID=UPI0031F77575
MQRTLIEVGMSGTLAEDQLSLLTAQLLRANERNERLIEGLLVLTEVDQARIGSTPQPLERIAGAVLLERLITNLVQNGIKYNRPGGTLHVTVGGSPALCVVNTGSPVFVWWAMSVISLTTVWISADDSASRATDSSASPAARTPPRAMSLARVALRAISSMDAFISSAEAASDDTIAETSSAPALTAPACALVCSAPPASCVLTALSSVAATETSPALAETAATSCCIRSARAARTWPPRGGC